MKNWWRAVGGSGFPSATCITDAEHITVDIGHADGWLNNVIVPIGKKHPAAMEEVFFGAALRLANLQRLL